MLLVYSTHVLHEPRELGVVLRELRAPRFGEGCCCPAAARDGPLQLRGASLDLATRYGKAPLHVACKGGFVEAVVALLEGGDNIDRSTVDGDVSDQSSYDGALPLHLACDYGKIKVALKLIERGADPYVKDRFEMTAFDYANFKRKRSICDRLRVIVESDVRLYVTPESHPRRGRLNDVVPLIALFIV